MTTMVANRKSHCNFDLQTKPKTMNQRITEYTVLVVESTIDPVSKEVCGGDHYNVVTPKSKARAFSMAKLLKNFYEVHVYEETNGDVKGHWIFKNGVMIENMFNN